MMYRYWLGGDKETMIPVVIYKDDQQDDDMYWGLGDFKMSHPFLWWEKRYGPMMRMDVLPVDGYGNVTDNSDRRPYSVEKDGSEYFVTPTKDRAFVMLRTPHVAEAIHFRNVMNRKAGFFQ